MKAFLLGWGVIALIAVPVIAILLIGYSVNPTYGVAVAVVGLLVVCVAIMSSVLAWLVGDTILDNR